MPRKVDPRWGEDGYGADDDHEPWTPVKLDDAELADLAEMLDIDPASSTAGELRSAVACVGDTYRRWKGRGATAFTRPEARKALENLLTANHLDCAALTALNERALQAAHDSLLWLHPEIPNSGDSVTKAIMENRIEEATLRQAMLDAISRLKETRGPDRDGELAWAVAELCEVYEEAARRQATLSNKAKDLSYQQEPKSEAGQFVRQCFRTIDASVSATRINRAMRFFIKKRGQDQGGKSVQTRRNTGP